MNKKKTEYMSFNQAGSRRPLKSKSRVGLKQVEDFLYLGSWVNTTERDLSVRIAQAWSASNKLETIWKSELSRKLKIQFFRATVESVLRQSCTSSLTFMGSELEMIIPGSNKNSDLTITVPLFKKRLKLYLLSIQKLALGDTEIWSSENLNF